MLMKKIIKHCRFTIIDPVISEMEETCYPYTWGKRNQMGLGEYTSLDDMAVGKRNQGRKGITVDGVHITHPQY